MQANFILIATGITCLLFHHGTAQTVPDSRSCQPPYVEIADKCYNFHQMMVNWEYAKTICGMEEAKLASVLTADQREGLLDHMNGNYPGTYWISGIPASGQWIWSTTRTPMYEAWWGTPWWDVLNWALSKGLGRVPPPIPGLCSYFCSDTLRYWAGRCSSQLRFICEKDLADNVPIKQL